MPESRLKAVVLPAPLGPIRAWRVRSRTAKETPRTALMPPKLLAMSSTARTGAPAAVAPSRMKAGGTGPTASTRRAAMAASVSGTLRNGAISRPATPTRPVGEKMMKPTKSSPKNSSQLDV